MNWALLAARKRRWIEWPLGEAAPTKYWLSNLPAKTKFRDLVDITKMRLRPQIPANQAETFVTQ